MTDIRIQILHPNDNETISVIAAWYLTEWNVPIEKSIQKLNSITADSSQLHVVMTIDGVPIATGGMHHRVGLMEKHPHYSIYKDWLALVYTLPDWRHRGHGAALCDFIQQNAKERGVKQMYLFTDTAERLYERLGWYAFERITYGTRNVVLMRKELKIEVT